MRSVDGGHPAGWRHFRRWRTPVASGAAAGRSVAPTTVRWEGGRGPEGHRDL